MIGRYTYNGLSWRTSKTTVGTGGVEIADDAAPVLRERRIFTYNASWQLVVEEIDDDLDQSPAPGSSGETLWPGIAPTAQDPDAGVEAKRGRQHRWLSGISPLISPVWRKTRGIGVAVAEVLKPQARPTCQSRTRMCRPARL